MLRGDQIKPANGKLGIAIVGLGAVTTTFIAGVEAIKKGIAKPYGSVTQMATIRLGKRTEDRHPYIKDFVPLAKLNDLEFIAWDIFESDAYEAALKAGVLEKSLLDQIEPELRKIKPKKAVFDPEYVKKLHGTHVKVAPNKLEYAKMLMEDVENFKKEKGLDRVMMVWVASTEVYMQADSSHDTIESFEQAMRENHRSISPSMIYAYAALKMGIPFINGAPNLNLEVPALRQLAEKNHVPVGGKDFKTGQTLMKTIIAPGLKARMIGLSGWFSTNILGNRDGEVLDDPESFKTKEVSKLSVIEDILQSKQYPELYGDIFHKVRINYYPPRGDNKESWDNIDIFGWLGYPMQIKINFLCRDSILAAPVLLDLILFTDLARRCDMYGVQEWLSFYWKSPMAAPKLHPENDLFIQQTKLKNTLRYMMKEDLITHLGLEYYDMM
ncbi:MAG TPA: inositol-3-phosphate synthase [Candidatus Cloacimonadota bacterium]|nr:inositol-3-phosphate synthase [Candidatus Cloacimonadota bacterium]HPT71498.1 inositol-3-phosphate synthase [Candidatus Cloacimonadota bacterium]